MPQVKLAPQDFPSALRCNRCTFTWMPRKKNHKPHTCPNCKSRRWWWPEAMIKFLDSQRTERETAKRAAAAKRPT